MRGWRCSACSDVGFASFSLAAPPLCALRRQRWLISAWDTLVGRLDAENERPPASAGIRSCQASHRSRPWTRPGITSFYNPSADAGDSERALAPTRDLQISDRCGVSEYLSGS